ncbi:hypothetical protein [Sporisorium scitamineum]|uniref:Uncharacterized protein n=1 Tax=Sporisorium scitamineum TaxID=49012 RepID=A0A0F7RWM9_9BASI|nr:hypothetical protein [Sporisorium scitamineum]
MAASTTMRPHSSASSGSSTPWLSPEASSATWRHSYTSSTDLSRSSSTAASTHPHAAVSAMPSRPSSSSSRDPHSQEWWEHVLPPGHLAERLRKAQRSTSASRRRSNPALANATPSERSAWKRLSGIPTEKQQHDRSESSTAASSRSSSFQAGPSAAATLPRSALKPSHRSYGAATINFGNVSQSESSAEVSSDKFSGSSTHQHSPHQNRFAFPSGERDATTPSRRPGVKTTANSPEMVSSSTWSADAFDSNRTISRNSGGRRRRVMSEDGIASSFFASAQSSSSSYRLPGSHSAVHLSQLASTSSESSAWTSTAADRARARYTHHSLPDTPELSSDDGADTTVRTSSSASSSKTALPPTILRSHFDRPDQPPSTLASDDVDGYTSPVDRRDRHVSFDQATEIPRRASVHDWTEPMTSSQSAFNFGSLPSRDYTSPFDSLPPRSNSTRRARHGVRASGRRTTSFSLPGSRRGSIRGDSPFQHNGATSEAGAGSQDASTRHRRATSIPDVVLLESLNVAHKQLASAGNLALTLTRQLSAPLRPVFHMTLFLSISSITVLSLACFLCASYMLTAWDDVSKRTHKVGEVAGRTKHRFEKTLDWGLRMLGPAETTSRSGGDSKSSSGKAKAKASGEAASGSGSTASSSGTASAKAVETKKRGPVLAAGHALLWPARMAFSGASTVAHTLTPPSISNMFSSGQQRDRPSAQGKGKAKSGSTLPPRPPLSTLLPSILFTLLLAIGAGLTSFLASRRAATEAAASAASGRHTSMPDTAGAQPYSVPLSGSSSPILAQAGMPWGHFSSSSSSSAASSPAVSPFVGSRRMNGWEKDGFGQQRRNFGVGSDAGLVR